MASKIKTSKYFSPKDRDAYLEEHREETREEVIEQFDKYKNGDKRAMNGYSSQLSKTGFFSQPNVKEYEKAMSKHLFGKDKPKKMGRGTFFNTNEELEKWIGEYIELCMECEVTPTISGLATWLRCSKEILYLHAKNPSSPFYDTLNSIINFCHTFLETGASEMKINAVAYIFQAKNYFGMKEQNELSITANTNNQETTTSETLNALKDQISQEQSDVKQIDMREAKIIEEKVLETVEANK